MATRATEDVTKVGHARPIAALALALSASATGASVMVPETIAVVWVWKPPALIETISEQRASPPDPRLQIC